MRILLIEDNPADATLIGLQLDEAGLEGVELSHATSLERGLDEIRGPLDAVLLDLGLPDGQGVELFERLKREASFLPVVVLTGIEDELIAGELVKAGAQDFLVKGAYSPLQLARSLRYAVERKRSEVALTYANDRLRDTIRRLQRRELELELLQELLGALQLTDGLADAYRKVARAMPDFLPGSSGWVRPAELSLEPHAWGVVTPYGEEPPRGGAHLGGAMTVDLAARGQSLGRLQIWLPPPTGEDGDPDALVGTLARQTALALGALKLREELREQSVRDPLTGLFNRRYLIETTRRELRRALRNDREVGLMMLDLDHFKAINDRFGHDAGDAVLVAFAEMLDASFRGEDIVSRYGGEEFMVVLPDASLENTERRAEDIRRCAAELAPGLGIDGLEPPTVSIGVASFPHHGRAIEDLFSAADGALYRAKRSGRNRIEVAPPLEAERET